MHPLSNKKKGIGEQKNNDEAGLSRAGHLQFGASVATFDFGSDQRFLICIC